MTAGQGNLLVLGRVLQGQQEDVVFRLRLQQLADTPLMSNGHWHDGEVVDPPVSPLDQKAYNIASVSVDRDCSTSPRASFRFRSFLMALRTDFMQ